jgi:hypothetical protein
MQLLQQWPSVRIKRVEPFGEPAVDRGELFASLLRWFYPAPRQSCAMLLIAARNSQDLAGGENSTYRLTKSPH